MEFNLNYFKSKNIFKFKKKNFLIIILYYIMCFCNKLDVVKELINKNFDLNEQNNNGDTSLHLSIRYKYDS